MNATEQAYGVVIFATSDEILAPNAATQKVVKPYDLYSFATLSESVEDDLGNIYADVDGDKPNNTITKAISQLTTAKVQKRSDSVISDDNISQYQYETLPIAGVKRQLGDSIEIPKSIVSVESLAGVADPKDYILYYLTQDEDPYDVGLYKKIQDGWAKIGQDAIIKVEALPDANIKQNCFYELANHDIVVNRYSLTETAKKNGYYADADGIHYGTTDASWAAIALDWSGWIDDEIVIDPDGLIYMVKHADASTELVYQYTVVDNALYYHYEDNWIQVSPVFVDKYMDADKNHIFNIDTDELKPQRAEDEGKTFVVDEFGEWQLDKIRNYMRVSTFTDLDPDDKTLYYLDTDDGDYDAGLYIYDETEDEYIAVGGGKSIVQIDDLTEVTNPKQTVFYEVKNDDDEMVELYIYRGTTWHRIFPASTYIRVSDFATVTDKQKNEYTLFYLDTDITGYDIGLYIYDETQDDFFPVEMTRNYVRVSTFDGVTGNEKIMYYLDTDITGYNKGLYIYDDTEAKFIPATDQPIIQVDVLTEVTDPKETVFYEVKNDDDDQIELYVYRGNTWHQVIRHPFEIVENELPDATTIVEDKMFLLKEDETDADDPAVVVHKEGLWLFDKATETYIDIAEPIDEDFINELDIED